MKFMTCDAKLQSPTWLLIAGAAVLLSMPGTMSATSILGTAVLDNGNGTVLVSGNGTTSGCIIWSTGTTMPSSACPTSGNGTFAVEPGSSTPPFTAGDTGTIDNLNFNQTLPLVGFMTVDGVTFDLTGIATNTTGGNIGVCSATTVNGQNWDSPGVTCTPAGSEFQLTNGLATLPNSNIASTVAIQFSVYAEAYMGSSGNGYSNATPYLGIFTTQSSMPISGNIGSILTAIESGNSVSASWSGNFSPLPTTPTTVPEPGSMALLGAGLILVGFGSRRAFKSHTQENR